MADINIERKRSSVWPWVIGLIVLAALIWALTQLFDRDEPQLEPAAVGMVEQVVQQALPRAA